MSVRSGNVKTLNRQNVKTKWRGASLAFVGAVLVIAPGCQELVHMGQISDRENAFAINGVKIEQRQPSGKWKHVGDTDGNGRWWIMKDKLKGGGEVRMSKPGYHPVIMSDAEFLQSINIVMAPADSHSGGFGESRQMPGDERPRR